jgi:hypothetical protein
MSGLLDHIGQDFTRRIDLRRRMMSHLGLSPTDSQAAALRDDIRSTLLACSRCADPAVCEAWMRQERPGTPIFCRGREAFLRLEAALEPPERSRLHA